MSTPQGPCNITLECVLSLGLYFRSYNTWYDTSCSHFVNVKLLIENKSFIIYSTCLVHPVAHKTRFVLPSCKFMTEMSKLRVLPL